MTHIQSLKAKTNIKKKNHPKVLNATTVFNCRSESPKLLLQCEQKTGVTPEFTMADFVTIIVTFWHLVGVNRKHGCTISCHLLVNSIQYFSGVIGVSENIAD